MALLTTLPSQCTRFRHTSARSRQLPSPPMGDTCFLPLRTTATDSGMCVWDAHCDATRVTRTSRGICARLALRHATLSCIQGGRFGCWKAWAGNRNSHDRLTSTFPLSSEDGCAWAWDAETGETLRGRGGRLVGHRAMVGRGTIIEVERQVQNRV